MSPAARASIAVVTLALASSLGGCATHENELQRAADHYAANDDDTTLALLRALEIDWMSFSSRDRARYAYLRGVTDYRIGYRVDARHWLAMAAQLEIATPGSLVPGEKMAVNEKLAELNAVVWSGDVLPNDSTAAATAPTTTPKSKAKKPKKPALDVAPAADPAAGDPTPAGDEK